MKYTTLIQAAELAALPAGDVVIADCRHQLTDPGYGRAAWLAGHVPGAQFLHLDRDLAGTPTGRNGRHPLPGRDTLAATLARIGLRRGQQLVAYDDAGGMFAARLWWLARWLGHDAVAVLDGGIAAWKASGGALQTGTPHPQAGDFAAAAPLEATVDINTVAASLDDPGFVLVDARGADRWRGENETLDPVGGHIPGSRNRPFALNLAADGRFKPAGQLAQEWQALLGDATPAQVVNQCGSGVTACHNLLALTHAGLPGSRLYPGSWSEWCRDPARPVARGA